MLALHSTEVYDHGTGFDVAETELLVVAEARSSSVGRARAVALPRPELHPRAARPGAVTP
jgi:hypothetical protein